MDYKQYQHEMERLENAVDKISRDRDAWKARAEKLAEALRSAERSLDIYCDPNDDGAKCSGHANGIGCIQDDIRQSLTAYEGELKK